MLFILFYGYLCFYSKFIKNNKIAGRTISDAVLEKWIEIHTDYLEVKGTLMVHEFLYLLCNSKDRKEMVSS